MGSRSCASCTTEGPTFPVVIVSARSDLPTKLRGFGLGASDYLAKPFSLDELVARVRVQVRRHPTKHDENVIRVGSLDPRPGATPGPAGARSSPIFPTASSGCCTISSSTRARSSAASACSPRSGGTTSTRARTWWRSVSAASARSSARRRRSKPSAMRVTGSARPRSARASAGSRSRSRTWPRWRSGRSWETIPFHFIWVSLTLALRLPRLAATARRTLSCAAVVVDDWIPDLGRRVHGEQLWGELFEVPLMSAMFLAMVWHARRRQEALAAGREAGRGARVAARTAGAIPARRLARAAHAGHDRTRSSRSAPAELRRSRVHEIDVALDELDRIERILERLLLLAKADHPDFVVIDEIDLEVFLEDVLHALVGGRPAGLAARLRAPPAGCALTRKRSGSHLTRCSRTPSSTPRPQKRSSYEPGRDGKSLVIEVEDEGCGVPADALGHIFERFARADSARSRAHGGVGLGLAIVDAIAKAHGGSCAVRTAANGSAFSLRLPGFAAAHTGSRAELRAPSLQR